jgi:23S rRNA (cytosine1962-C5)-methyltransferase
VIKHLRRRGAPKRRAALGSRAVAQPVARAANPVARRAQPPTVTLSPGREKSIARHHPWLFSGAIASVSVAIAAGEAVRVQSAEERFLAWGAFSPRSQIRVRVWSWDEAEAIDAAYFERRIAAALARRKDYSGARQPRGALRLVNAEADGMPGLIADRYADTVVVQFLAAGADRWRAEIAAALTRLTGCRTLYERSDAEVRALEGLPERNGLITGDEPGDSIEILEGEGATACRFLVDIRAGHKTGFYLDHAENRGRIAQLCSERTVLNCFAYTGGFSIAALRAGAHSVDSIESSADALQRARAHVTLNGLDASRVRWIEADAFKQLRVLRDQGARYDVIILDPPKFAPTAAHVERAARAYKDINLHALRLLHPGGLLATFSCSGAIDAGLFQSIVAGAAQDARVDVQVLSRLQAASDHPVVLAFPEGEYLKGLLLRAAP